MMNMQIGLCGGMHNEEKKEEVQEQDEKENEEMK